MSAARTRCPGRTRTGKQCLVLLHAPAQACRDHLDVADGAPTSADPSGFEKEVYKILEREVAVGHTVTEVSNSVGGTLMVDVTGAGDTASWMLQGLHDEGANLGDELDELIDEGDRVLKNGLAQNTVEHYRAKFAPFERWCSSVGATSLPARPQVLAAYILRIARLGTTRMDATYDDADVDDSGRLRATTIAATVAAIGAVHRNNGFVDERDPSRHPRVRKMVGAYARTYRHHAVQAHGFSLQDLGLMIDRCLIPAHARARDLVLILLATHPLIEVNGNQLGRLWWDMVELPDPADGTASARLEFGGRTGAVWVVAEPSDARLCPVSRLRMWRMETGGHGPVFPSPRDPGRPTTRQGLVDRVGAILKAAGAPTEARLGEFAQLTPTQREAVVTSLAATDDLQARDRALMATAWWLGQRAEVIERLDVTDLNFDPVESALTVFVRRSKVDQYGEGAPVVLTAQPGYVGCPIEALTAWLWRYARLVGCVTQGDTEADRFADLVAQLSDRKAALFPRLNRGAPEGRLGYDGINGVTKKYASLAGIIPSRTERVSSQGFRAGNVIEMFQDNRSAEEIARHQLRTSTQHLLTYYRPRSDIDHSPVRGLASRRAQRRNEPRPDPGSEFDAADWAVGDQGGPDSPRTRHDPET